MSFIDPFAGGDTTLQEFVSKAQAVCATPNTDQPFMCLDLIYISTLLQDGYDLKPTTTIKVNFVYQHYRCRIDGNSYFLLSSLLFAPVIQTNR